MLIVRRKPDRDKIGEIIASEFRCQHTEGIRCKRIKTNNDVEVLNQCKRCGAQIGNAIRHLSLAVGEIDLLPKWDDRIFTLFSKAKDDRVLALVQQAEDECYVEWSNNYEAYRETDEWKKRRSLVLYRAQGICEACRMAAAVEAHHLTYDHLGEEFLFELVAVCRKCHGRIHSKASSPHPMPV